MRILEKLEAVFRATAENRPISVKSVILTRDHKVLLLKRPVDKSWDLPGGGIDGDETIADALIREVQEETGLGVQNAMPVYAYIRVEKGKPEKLIQFVLCHMDHKACELEITLSDEHESYTFFTHHEIRTLPLMPSYVEALRRIRKVEAMDSQLC